MLNGIRIKKGKIRKIEFGLTILVYVFKLKYYINLILNNLGFH